MPVIRANRDSVNDRFSVLGFSIRTETPLYEVGIASDPDLFKSENRARRNRHNFYSSRALGGALRARRGEGVYLVPPDVMQNFLGQSKLYYGLATYAENSGGTPNFVQSPTAGNMFVNITNLTERGLRRLAGRPSGSTSYGNNGAGLVWGGDVMNPAQAPATSPAPAPSPSPTPANITPPPSQAAAPAPAAKGNGAAPPPVPAGAAALRYDDGFGDFPGRDRPKPPAGAAGSPARLRALADTDDYEDGGGIDGPIPDDDTAIASSQGVRALDSPQAEYPGASRFAPAHASNYRAVRDPRTIEHIVIHITDGGSKITGTIGWFQNPDQRNAKNQPIHVSAHYVVGQDGEVVQMVRNNDIAWHASRANGHSIGIEHVANKKGLNPTEAQYQASARLVAWLCGQFSLALDRDHIVGHYEISPQDNHDCPSRIWDWDHYMDLVQATAAAPAVQSQSLGLARVRTLASRTLPVRAQSALSSLDKFTWPEGLDGSGTYVADFVDAYNTRLATNVLGKDATGDAAQRARFDALNDHIPRIASTLTGDGGAYISDAILRVITAVSMQVLDAIKDVLPQTLYAPVSLSPSDPPPQPRPTVAMPRNLQYLSQRAGIYLAWVDAAIQRATADTATRIRRQKEQWEAVLGLLDEGFTLLGLVPGLGEAAAAIGTAVHLVVADATPDFDGRFASFASAMQAIRNGYRSLASAVLTALIKQRYGNSLDLGIPLDADVQTYVNDHAAHVLRGWEDELEFLGLPAGSMAQSLGVARRRATAIAQEIITPFYDPKDPASALTCQNDTFSQAREEWFVGVDNTKLFPHSAICQINTVDSAGNGWGGTGFYIGRNRILTAAHVLQGMVSATIIPAKNDTEEPFGNCTVSSSSWRVAPTYTGSGNYENDLAVIDNVPIAAPNGQWFSFLNASPSDQLSIVVCGYSAASDAVPELTHAIDGDKQHLHGGFVRGSSNPEVIEYPILTLHGASGAPVYHLDGSGAQLQALVCAVHVTGQPAAQGLNRGCFITPAKIDWIEGRARAFALANECYSIHWDTVPYYSQQTDSSCWAAAAAMVVAWRDGITLSDADIAAKVPLVTSYWNGLLPTDRRVLADLWNLVPEPPACYTIDNWRDMLQTYGPLFLDMTNSALSGGHAWVLVGMTSDGAEDGSDTVMYLHNPWPTKGKVKWKFPDFLKLYEGRVSTEGNTLECQILHAAAVPSGCRPVTAAPFALAVPLGLAPIKPRRRAAANAMSSSDNSDNAVPLVPQPDKLACWAAAMTMLLSFRRKASYTPESLANEVGKSLMQSYGWDLLNAVRDRYGFVAIDVPSNTSLYFDAAQWAQWLQQYGPLWVVIVGMPHAVVLSGLRGDTANASSVEVHILNPWDTRVEFDSDPVAFNPPNQGYDSWQPFSQFASDFGNMAEPNYGNWRILHLPAGAATPTAQSLGASASARARARWAAPPPKVLACAADASSGESAIDPTRVPGTTMRTCRGQSNRVRWQLDQLEGLKSADPAPAVVGSELDNVVALDQWPNYGTDPVPLPLTARWTANGSSVGNVRIEPGAAAALNYDVEVIATIDDDAGPVPPANPVVACLKLIVEYRFRGTPDGDRTARSDLRLYGNGRHDFDSRWI